MKRRHIAFDEACRRFRTPAYISLLNLPILMGIMVPKLRAKVSRFARTHFKA